MFRHARCCPPCSTHCVVDVFNNPPHLFGHSDGGSIALIHAAIVSKNVASIIVAAPHTFVEKLSVDSIAKTRDVYLNTDLKSKLARHHRDPDSAFLGMERYLARPRVSRLGHQPFIAEHHLPRASDTRHGRRIRHDGNKSDNIAAALPAATLLKLESCGHSPHRDRPDAVINAVRQFLEK
jgi:pimeloyl-ACP methyl ester carboxylesterase